MGTTVGPTERATSSATAQSCQESAETTCRNVPAARLTGRSASCATHASCCLRGRDSSLRC